jgi:hypothetical protein
VTDFIHEEINADNSQHTDAPETPSFEGVIQPPSARDDIIKSWNEHNETKFEDRPKKPLGVGRERDQRGKFTSGAEQATSKPQQVSQPGQDATPSTATKQEGPPQNWSDGSKALWNQIPSNVQQALHQEWAKREADSKAGFEKYKARYQDMEREAAIFSQELNHVMPVLQQMRVSPGTFLRDGINWFRKLSSPNRVQEAGNFLRALGIDPATVAGFQPQQQQTIDQYGNPVVNQLVETVNQLANDLGGFKQQRFETEKNRVISDLEAFKKDKPYMEQLGPLMAQMIGAGRHIKPDGHPDYPALYEDAKWLHPEVRNAILQEAATKQQTQQQQVIAQQKHAGRTLPAARAPMHPGYQPARKPNGKQPTAREDIVAALNEVRGQY